MIIGFDKQKKYFDALIKNGALGRAYIFSGEDMIGKKLFALEIYKKLNPKVENTENDPDLKIISQTEEEGNEIPIAKVRELKSFLSLTPYYGPHKCVLIDNAEMLTTEASNALLKILEEPPSFAVIFLVTSKPKAIFPTILSRCERVNFQPQTSIQVSEYIKSHKVNKDDENLLISIANGRIGSVSRILAGKELPGIKKTVADFKKIPKSGLADRLLYAKTIYEKEDYVKLAGYWLTWLYSQKNNLSKPKILSDLLLLNNNLSKAEFNHRLALENFLINI